jgi:hypothetical protein
MDILDLKNLQLSYQAVYDNTLSESMKELGIIDEERLPGVKPYKPSPTQAEIRADEKKVRMQKAKSTDDKTGYGPDEKFYKPEDKKIPDAKTAEWLRKTIKKFGRPIGKYDPKTIRTQEIIDKMPKEKPKPKMVKKDGKWVREAQEYYNFILSHLLDEGYASNVESAEAIMMNMSEAWVNTIIND